MPPLFPLDRPASGDLFNAACDAGIDWAEGTITEDYHLSVMALYQASERASFERAWKRSEAP